MNIKISADSTCDLSPELIARYDIGISPLYIVRDGESLVDGVDITPDEIYAHVEAVGRKMAYRPGVSGKIFAKLGENGVNIRMITQGPEELNIIVGVEEKDFEQAIRVLYHSFVKENVVS